VSSVYDKALASTGLTVTQHALLVNIALAGKIGRTFLAAQLGMDRTTLTRNLKPIEKAGLVMAAESSDKRERLLCLSTEGRCRLRQSYVSWEKAQKELTREIGPDALENLRAALDAAERAAAAALDKDQESGKPAKCSIS
jgi:DNA-binding MarR family transcriptional regulator